jgi:hypothetical protein
MGSAAMVFSHPNHEIAVLGTIARTRPHVVFLTDGGGEDRVAQSRSGLSSYLQQESLHFLNHSEASFYDALLARKRAEIVRSGARGDHLSQPLRADVLEPLRVSCR